MLNNYTEVDFEKWATGRNFLKPFLFKSHKGFIDKKLERN